MLRHLFKLIWNRKRANSLLIIEIFFSFVVLFGVGAVLLRFGQNYRSPLGFDSEQVWRLTIAAPNNQTMPRAELDDVLRQVKALPGVAAVALTSGNLPFTFSVNNSQFHYQTRFVESANFYDADDSYARVLGLKLREGRWFQATDDATNRRPVVITQDIREALFGTGPALGKVFHYGDSDKNMGTITPQDDYEVMGVVDNVRMDNDFTAAEPSVWKRLIPYDTTHWESANVLMHVAPGEGGMLQERVARTVAGVTRQWTTEVRYTLTPVLGLVVVGAFLILNVALGLFGVLWYNISQRRAEIGLRRAMGATGAAITRQFMGEIAVVTTLGVALGTLLAVQFPLLGTFGMPSSLYASAIAAAAGLVYVITGVCAWQPSRMAAGIRPAVALREE
jgi:putative ABC transport system permease protein